MDINGNDLLKLGFKGKDIGITLNIILEKVIKGDIENVKDSIISFIKGE